MSAAEINDARCPDCNMPTIWEQTDGAWKPMRCDACDALHDDGPRSSADDAEGYHDLACGSVEVFWGPDYNYPPGWHWWSCSPGCLPDGDGTPSASFGRSSEALEDAKTDEDYDEPAQPGCATDRTETRCAVRTRYLGSGRWSVTDGGSFDRPARRLVYRGDHQRNEDGHRAAADAWLERFVRTDREYPFPHAAVHNLGLAFGADDKYWTWNLDGGKR